jgi:hypothetical protein
MVASFLYELEQFEQHCGAADGTNHAGDGTSQFKFVLVTLDPCFHATTRLAHVVIYGLG